MFKIAVRELRRNALFFAVCFFITLVSAAISYLGIRILCATDEVSRIFEAKNDAVSALIFGGFLLSVSILLCLTTISLAYSAFPKRYKRNLNILCELNIPKEKLCVLFVLQTVTYFIPAVILGMGMGEALNQFKIPLKHSLSSHGIWGSLYRVFLIYMLIAIAVSVITSILSLKKSTTTKAVGRRSKLGSKGALYFKLGIISLVRRKRPISAIIITAVSICALIIFGSVLDFSTYYASTPMQKCIFDASVNIYKPDKTIYDSVLSSLDGYSYSSWRTYSTKNNTFFPEYKKVLSILPDDQFDRLASTISLLPSDCPKHAILQNCKYDSSDHYKKTSFVSDTEHVISGTIDNARVDIVGFLNEMPLSYSSGFTAMTSTDCRMFVRESDFPNIGNSDTFTIWFSGNTEQETMLLIDKFNQMDDNVFTAKYIGQTHTDIFLMYIRSAVILFSPIFILGLILFFIRDIQSREEEFELLYSLGVEKKKLFTYLAVDYLLLMAILFIVTSVVSIIAMKFIEFEAAGFYLPFYMPLGGIALCGTLLIFTALISICLALFHRNHQAF